MHDIDSAALTAWLEERERAGLFSGVLRITRGPETLFAHATGLASRAHGVPNTLDTRFAVASVGKWPLAITALRLVERGELALDTPLLELLPREHQPVALTPEHTLHHLLSHTSGLANYADDEDPTWDSFAGAVARMPNRGRVPADLVPLFRDLPARRPPGVAYEYSDTNFVLVGLVLEAVTGREWSTVLADEVLSPVGMQATAVEAFDEDPLRAATGYLVDDGPVDRRRTNVFSSTARGMPDGGMYTTAGDIATFVDALLGGRLIGPGLLETMLRPHAPSVGEPTEQYGYGCLLAVDDGRVTIVGHGGGDPGVSCMVAHHLDAGVTIVVLCNQDAGAWAATLEATHALGLRDPRQRDG
jgi:CubicO group peptidase (beta-lactamase class C family)